MRMWPRGCGRDHSRPAASSRGQAHVPCPSCFSSACRRSILYSINSRSLITATNPSETVGCGHEAMAAGLWPRRPEADFLRPVLCPLCFPHIALILLTQSMCVNSTLIVTTILTATPPVEIRSFGGSVEIPKFPGGTTKPAGGNTGTLLFCVYQPGRASLAGSEWSAH
jgi:hypothetical protein